jgi:hypothetical protein
MAGLAQVDAWSAAEGGGMSEHDDAVRPLLGGYVLGGLDHADQLTVDAHLSGCAGCRAEVDRLAAVPELLQRLPADLPQAFPQAPSRDGLDAFLRRAGRPARRRRAGLLAGTAVAALIAAAVVWFPRSSPVPPANPQPTQSSPTGTVVQFVAAAGSALSGRATLFPRQWGVSVALEVNGLPGEGPFVLRVVGRGGQEEQAACWGRTTSASARVTGASSIQLPNVDKVTVSDHDGHLLGTAAQR